MCHKYNKAAKKSMKDMKTKSRRDFLKKSVLAGASLVVAPSLLQTSSERIENLVTAPVDDEIRLIVLKSNGLKITSTFLDEISHDIPHQNFPPIKFNKLYIKLEMAKRAGYDKAITFGLSHFVRLQTADVQVASSIQQV